MNTAIETADTKRILMDMFFIGFAKKSGYDTHLSEYCLLCQINNGRVIFDARSLYLANKVLNVYYHNFLLY